MKEWKQTRHHAILAAYGFEWKLASSPTTRNPGESKVGYESHHYVTEGKDAGNARMDGRSAEEIQTELQTKFEQPNTDRHDAPFGAVQVEVKRTARGWKAVARRPWPASSLTPFRSRQPPTAWQNSAVHATLISRDIHFQRTYIQGRYAVYEYLMNTQKEVYRRQSELREVIRDQVAKAIPEGVRGIIHTEWHPARKTESAYQHALIVQVKIRINPPRTT